MKQALLLFTAGLCAVGARAQNDCLTAVEITPGQYTMPAFVGVPPTLFCAPNGNTATHGTWYRYTPLADHLATVSTDLVQNTGQDTRVHIYSGSCASPVCAGGDDDSGTGNLSVASFNAMAGTTYIIVFDDRFDQVAFDFTLSEAPPLGPGDNCAYSIPITPGTYSVEAIDGSASNPLCVQTGAAAHGRWYTYTPALDAVLTVTTDLPQNAGDNTRFHIYTGNCAQFMPCEIGDDDSGTDNTSVATFLAEGGTRYTIVFDDRWSGAPFDFSLTEAPLDPGYTCNNAISIEAGVTYTVDTISGIAPTNLCVQTGAAPHGIWYTYMPTANYGVTVTTDLPQNLGDDTRFHVFTGACGNFMTCRAGDDDAGSGNLSTATFNVTAGVVYTIVFDDRWANTPFDFILTEGEPLPVPISFTPSTTMSVYAMGAVDMNGDNLDDVVAPDQTTVLIYEQQNDGTLSPVYRQTPSVQHQPSWSFCAGDLDRNGYVDMMYGSGQGASFLMANGDGSAYNAVNFSEYIFCQRTNMVDLDNDGDLDAFSCHDVDANVYFTNDGTGALAFHQGGFGPTCGNYGSLFVDYDNDGDQDLFVAKCGCDPVDLFLRNDGGLSFNSVAGEYGFQDSHQSWSSAWGDFDNDGDMDVLVGSSSSTVHKLMRNDSPGFTNVTPGSGIDSFNSQSIEWVTHDFNNDGYLDILGGYGFLLGHGDMTFTPVEDLPTNGPVGDLNNDGFLDIVSSGRVNLNDGNDNHWLTVNTVGTVSNVDGIGARVQISSDLGSQIRDVRSGDGFEYMSSLNTHFGLGADSVVTNLTVYWPSGLISNYYDISADQTVTVVEGVSTVVPETPASGMGLYPVPAENVLYVRGLEKQGVRTATVLNAAGQQVLRTTVRSGAIDVSSLAPGMYLLRVDGDGGLQSPFVKQ